MGLGGAGRLVLREDLGNGRIIHLKSFEASDDLIIRHSLELLLLRTQRCDGDARIIHLGLHTLEDGLLCLPWILHAFRIQIVDFGLEPYLRHQIPEILGLFSLFRDLVFKLNQRSGNPALLLVNSLLLVFQRDGVGQISRLLTILIKNGDLDQVGTPHLRDTHHRAQLEVGDIPRSKIPFLKQFHGVQNGIEDLLALNDLKLGGDETRVGPLNSFSTENVHVIVVLLDLHGDRGLILPRGEVSGDSGRDDHEKEDQDDQGKADADDPPIVQHVKIDLTGIR